MRKEILRIDFIDESVDPAKAEQLGSDYIGSVRIPLRDLITHEYLGDNYPVVD